MLADEKERERWAVLTEGLRAEKAERDSWTCQIVTLSLAVIAAGIVALIMGDTWLPVWAKTVFVLCASGGVVYGLGSQCDNWEEALKKAHVPEFTKAVEERASSLAKGVTTAAMGTGATAAAAATKAEEAVAGAVSAEPKSEPDPAPVSDAVPEPMPETQPSDEPAPEPMRPEPMGDDTQLAGGGMGDGGINQGDAPTDDPAITPPSQQDDTTQGGQGGQGG